MAVHDCTQSDDRLDSHGSTAYELGNAGIRGRIGGSAANRGSLRRSARGSGDAGSGGCAPSSHGETTRRTAPSVPAASRGRPERRGDRGDHRHELRDDQKPSALCAYEVARTAQGLRMNEIPPGKDESEDVDEHYRRISALDPSRPSESVRRAVLERAARLAEERTANNAPTRIGSTRPSRRQTWWRPAAFGTLAAAVLAGVLIAPQFLTPRAPPRSASAPAQVSQPRAAATPATPAEIKEQPPGSAADERPPSPASSPSPASPEAQGNAAPTADSAAEIGAKNALAKVQSTAKARSGAAASSDSETDARRTHTTTSTVSAMPAPPQAAAPVVPAEPAAELRRAAEIGDVTKLQSLLGNQPGVNVRDENGRTALMLATLHGQTAAVEALLARGADPNAADARGITPLQAAVAGNQPAIAAALQRAGAR